MKKEELKDGVFYIRLEEEYKNCILQYNKQNINYCKGYWISGTWGINWIFNVRGEWREATLEELNALGDEHLPYSKYLQNDMVSTTYTIKDLAGGRVAVINDGTLEDLYKVISTAFPKDNYNYKLKDEVYIDDSLKANLFLMKSKFNEGHWKVEETSQGLPTQSVKVFLKEIEGGSAELYNSEIIDDMFKQIEEPNIIREWLEANPNPEIHKQVEREAEQLMREQKLIRRFPTGAVRSNSQGRPRPDWVSPYAIEEISKVLVDNANDFGGANYLLGIPELDCLESLKRHVGELQEALLITKDSEQARLIARSVGFNIVAMLHTMILKEKGLYNEIFDKTELVTVEEARSSNQYMK